MYEHNYYSPRRFPWVPVDWAVLGFGFSSYLANQAILKTLIGGTFLHCYANDVLGGMVAMAWINVVFVFGGKPKWRITELFKIVVILAYAGLFFEYGIPMIKSDSTCDPLDLVAYQVGGFGYWMVNKVMETFYGKSY